MGAREQGTEVREQKRQGNEMIESFRDLKVYQRAYTISLRVHEISLKLPELEKHELGSQIRRASKSIAMNIAEGYARNSSLQDFRRFLIMALGSCEEVRVQIDYLKDLKYIPEKTHSELEQEYIEIGKMLVAMINKWK